MENLFSGVGLLFKIILSMVIFGSVFLSLLGLPGNFVILILAAGFFLISGSLVPHLSFLLLLLVMAGIGELLEFGGGAWAARRYEVPRPVFIASIVGGIVGAFLGAPFFFGLGALLFSLSGVYLGALLAEYQRDNDWPGAREAAKVLLLGRVGGSFMKIMIGIPMAVLTIYRMFPNTG
jgi:hypothetical protein